MHVDDAVKLKFTPLLFLLQNIDCGYLLEMPQLVPTINVLNKNIEKIKRFLMNYLFFTAENNLCILHGQVFVMTALIPK